MNARRRPFESVPRLLYTVQDAAVALAVSETTMRELLRTGRVARAKVGRVERITLDALWDFIETLEEDAPPRRPHRIASMSAEVGPAPLRDVPGPDLRRRCPAATAVAENQRGR